MRAPIPPNTHPKSTKSSSHPLRMLVVLTLGVMLAHWLLLSGAPLAMTSHTSRDDAPALTFTTRTISPPVATPLAPPPVRRRAKPKAPQSADRTPVQQSGIEAPLTAQSDGETPGATDVNAVDPSAVAVDLSAQAVAALPPEGDATPISEPTQAVTQYTYPAPVRLKYDIRGKEKSFPYSINGELLWQQDGKTYDARLEISHFLLGAKVQTSTGQLTPQGLEPTRFGDKFRSEVAAHFERSKNKVTFSANTPDVPLLAGAQDQVSVFMQVASMMAGAPGDFPAGTTLTFQAIGPRSSASWTFTVGDFEKLDLPGGEVNAVRLWRDPTGPYEPKGEIWLAPSMGYMPVRIRLSKSEDDFSDMRWSATKKP